MKPTFASFFTGIGGMDFAFQDAGFQRIYQNEIDKYCIRTLNYNFSQTLDTRDIRDVPIEEIPKMDVMIAGFPCQPFSKAGKQEGFEDQRGNLVYFLIPILQQLQPKVIFLENVSNFKKYQDSLIHLLKESHYDPNIAILDASKYGNIPQHRERWFLVAFRDKKIEYHFPKEIPLTCMLEDILKWDQKVEEEYYIQETWKHYNLWKESITEKGSLYQWRRNHLRKNQHHLCPTFTAQMGTGGHNVPLMYTDFGIRKLTIEECLVLQGFPKTFQFPKNLALNQKYKQIGNSVCIPVIRRIAKSIYRCLK